MNINLYVIEDYENEPPSGPKKQTQNKPNFFKGQNEQKIASQKIWQIGQPNKIRNFSIFPKL